VQTTDHIAAISAKGYAGLEPTNPPDWHALVVWDMFFNALTTGLFITAGVGELMAPATFVRVAVWAYPLALALLISDLSCLVLDLGKRLRFHHMLRVFKPTSPMSLGTWCLTAYALPLTLLVGLDLFGGPGWAHWLLMLAALPLAFGSAMYKGVLFSMSAQPGWRDARWLGAFHTSGAFVVGGAALLLLSVLTRNVEAVAALRPALAALVVLNLIPLGLVAGELHPAFARAHGRGPRTWFVASWLLGGLALPLGLLAVGGIAADLVAAALLLAAGFAVRSVVVRLPHAIHQAPAWPGRPVS
jgi:hypothetical protein